MTTAKHDYNASSFLRRHTLQGRDTSRQKGAYRRVLTRSWWQIGTYTLKQWNQKQHKTKWTRGMHPADHTAKCNTHHNGSRATKKNRRADDHEQDSHQRDDRNTTKPWQQWQQIGEKTTRQGKKKSWCNHCKSWVYHSSDKCYMLEKNKQNCPPWYNNLMSPNGTKKKNQEWWGQGSK